MTRQILTEPMTATAFAPFGDLLDCAGDPDKLINQGLCGRYHDRASLDFADGRAGISLFKAELRSLPSAASPAIREFTTTALPLYSRLAQESRALIANLDRLTDQIQRDPTRFFLDSETPEFRR